MFILVTKHVQVGHFKGDHEGVLEFCRIFIKIQQRLQALCNDLSKMGQLEKTISDEGPLELTGWEE